MKIPLEQLFGYIKADERAREKLERVLRPLFDSSTDELDELAEAMRTSSGRALLSGSMSQGILTSRVLDDVERLLHSVRAVTK